jgi:radical SAM superfamily enzyme YgiQ (UPF0313 family)
MINEEGQRKLLLINPRNAYRKGIYNSSEYSVPPINLGIIAALTPKHWQVEIFDENFESFSYREADIVGFTALTSQVNRAYEIAAIYRRNGVPTVLGGIHASMMPDEAATFVDVVVQGEGESVWHQIIRDFEEKNLKKVYKGELLPLVDSPFQRLDLYHNAYALGAVQTTRGCPMKCDFCSVHAINGRKYRHRNIEDVVNEFSSIPQNRVYIVDDDFYGYTRKNAERAAEICSRIIAKGIKKEWYTFTSMHIAEDEATLKLMSDAGCRVVLLGIESEVVDQLQSAGKKTNLRIGTDNYEKVYDAIHRQGIAVLGSFIFGLDNDTPESIERRVDYYINSGVDCIQAGILTPLPGTGTYFRLLKENRITHTNYPSDWEHYTFFNTVIKPLYMSPEQLMEVMLKAWDRIYDLKVIKKKYLMTLKLTKNPQAAAWALHANVGYRNTAFEGIKEELDFTEVYKSITGISLDKKLNLKVS